LNRTRSPRAVNKISHFHQNHPPSDFFGLTSFII
jgi:hypothetical protein